MKRLYLLIVMICIMDLGNLARGQQVIVTDDASYTTPANGSVLDVKSTTKGFIVPRMTTAQRTTLGNTTPINGVMVFDTDLKSFWYWETDIWMQIAASGLNLTGIKFGDAANYSTFEADGTLMMYGEAIVWDDVRVSLVLRPSGGTSPVFSVMQGTLYAYKFSGASLNEIFFEVQMPHSWVEGSTIYPHIHWASNGTATNNVTWGMDYEWRNINETFIGGTLSSVNTSVAASGTRGNQQITNLSATGITDSGKKISSMMICRLYRAGDSDANNEDCFLLAFDIHYQSNTIGSRQILLK